MGTALPEWLNTFINTYLVSFVVNLVWAALILIVGFALVKTLLKLVAKITVNLDANIQTFIHNFVGIALKVIVILTAVIVIGVPESSVIAVLGSCGLAIGLALQGGLSNIASGIILMFCKPFHVGDFIISGDISGVVKDIGIYYTLITTPDNQDIHVPNSTLAGSTITNLSTQAVRRLDFNFSVSYDSDLDLTRKVLLAATQMNDLVMKDPAPVVLVTSYDASATTVRLRVWCASENYWTVNFDMWEDVKKAFDKFNIEIPYQYVNVIMKDKA